MCNTSPWYGRVYISHGRLQQTGCLGHGIAVTQERSASTWKSLVNWRMVIEDRWTPMAEITYDRCDCKYYIEHNLQLNLKILLGWGEIGVSVYNEIMPMLDHLTLEFTACLKSCQDCCSSHTGLFFLVLYSMWFESACATYSYSKLACITMAITVEREASHSAIQLSSKPLAKWWELLFQWS